MENIGPAGSNPFESSTEDTGKPNPKKTKASKKKQPIFESTSATAAPDKKEKTERDIAWAMDRFAWFDEQSPAAKKTTPNQLITDATAETTETAETAETTEAEADAEALKTAPETLTESETYRLRQTIAQDHLEAIRATKLPEQTELQPAADFLRYVSEGTDAETAFAEVAAETGLTEPEIQEALQETSVPELPETLAAPDTWRVPVAPPAEVAEAMVLIDTDNEDEGEINLRRSPVTTMVPTAAREAAPTPVNLPDAAHNYYQRRSRRGSSLLATGLTGYVVGRRRSSIKTEKKLRPVQRKLERQVTHLERDLTRKEQQLVAIKAVRSPRVEQPLQERQAPLTVRVEQRPQLAIQPLERRVQPGRKETRLGLKKPEHAGRLGAVVLAIEAPRAARRAEKAAAPVERTRTERPHNIRQAFDAEYVKTMHRGELLELSEKIVIEGASLRHIYESRLIGEKQLRHLVSEYLQGKDIRRQLRKEMVEHEIDFERDPILRDRVRSKMSGQQQSGGLQELLAKAGVLPTDDKHAATIAAAESRRAAKEAKAAAKRRTADTAMVTVIVVLALVVIGLLVR